MNEKENERRDVDLESLGGLPARDASPELAARTRRRALAQLAVERRYLGRPRASAVAAAWSRIGMPVALAGVVGVYLTWAFELAGALYR